MPVVRPGASDGPNGWAEYRRLVLAELERLSSAINKVESQETASHQSTIQIIHDMRELFFEKIAQSSVSVHSVQDERRSELEDRVFRIMTELKEKYDNDIKELKEKYDNDIKELKEKHHKDMLDTKAEQNQHGNEISALKAKAAVLGAIAGFLVAIISVVVNIYFKS